MSADQLVAHALDLFAPLGPGVTARRMFGALGFYAGGRFFAVGDVEEGALYLKVDELTRAAFEAAGGRPFTYRAKDGGVVVMSYISPPDAALEDPEAMLPWARLGLEAAARSAAKKRPRSPRRSKPPPKPKPKPKPMTRPRPGPGRATRRATKRR